MENKRSFINRGDFFILLAVILACGSFLLYRYYNKLQKYTGENIAVITLGNNDIMNIDLGNYYDEPVKISLKEDYNVPVSFLLENGTIRFVDVTCPDHICEQYGTLKYDLDMAMCLPNQTSVIIYTPEDLGITK